MSNNFVRSKVYSRRRKSNLTPISFNLTQTEQGNSTLFYSNTQLKLIDAAKIPSKQIQVSQPLPFVQENSFQPLCKRHDDMDRKFHGVGLPSRSSSPNIRIVSPKKVDITLLNTTENIQLKNDPIHSLRNFSKKLAPERDSLKQFRILEEMRKELRSRNYQNSSRKDLSLPSREIKTANTNSRNSQSDPQQFNKGGIYLEVRNRISKRYNQMFKKLAQSKKLSQNQDNIFLLDIKSSKSVPKKERITK